MHSFLVKDTGFAETLKVILHQSSISPR